MKKKEKQEEHEAVVELEYPMVPYIPPVPPVMVELTPVEGLGCEVVVGSLDRPSWKRMYKPCGQHTEGKHPLYGIGFNFMDARYYDIFATVGGNRSFNGHGGPINEIRTHALKPSLIISASKDESVRLWNIHTGICILIFAGVGGHRNEVLRVVGGACSLLLWDFHPSDIERFASCGMDNTVKIWSMKEFGLYVDKSYSWTDLPSKFPTKHVQFPSVQDEIVLWEPKTKEISPGEGSVDILQKYPVLKCGNWFVKFSCDFFFNQLAIGQAVAPVVLAGLMAAVPRVLPLQAFSD
ncbi:Polycomb group protein FIE2 [Dichanthelium oligosanthes]|uniref:Polycomb group protein FIE2 n=1 Tax=Dichanthelium oligosanthes TaxID=888268 RepID=A0A1E5VNP5_9POAL|nr:Polycomb group protein FIE2 [Dichanthelium oligosanthes]